jgi:hypothetical protein
MQIMNDVESESGGIYQVAVAAAVAAAAERQQSDSRAAAERQQSGSRAAAERQQSGSRSAAVAAEWAAVAGSHIMFHHGDISSQAFHQGHFLTS